MLHRVNIKGLLIDVAVCTTPNFMQHIIDLKIYTAHYYKLTQSWHRGTQNRFQGLHLHITADDFHGSFRDIYLCNSWCKGIHKEFGGKASTDVAVLKGSSRAPDSEDTSRVKPVTRDRQTGRQAGRGSVAILFLLRWNFALKLGIKFIITCRTGIWRVTFGAWYKLIMVNFSW